MLIRSRTFIKVWIYGSTSKGDERRAFSKNIGIPERARALNASSLGCIPATSWGKSFGIRDSHHRNAHVGIPNAYYRSYSSAEDHWSELADQVPAYAGTVRILLWSPALADLRLV